MHAGLNQMYARIRLIKQKRAGLQGGELDSNHPRYVRQPVINNIVTSQTDRSMPRGFIHGCTRTENKNSFFTVRVMFVNST